MSLDPDRTPVVVAVGQQESRDLLAGPLDLAAGAARLALDAAPRLAAAIERVSVVNILSRRAGIVPASAVCQALGLDVARETTSVGGNTPQALIERAASEIAAGHLGATLIVGAEAIRSGRLRPATRPEEPAGEVIREPVEPDAVWGEDRQDLSDEERTAGVLIPVHVYPLFESVLAANAGRSPAAQRDFIGALLAPFTAVAAAHPHAWFQQERSPAEIATISPDNRLVAEPYTKTMVAFLGGAQAAAVVVTSLSVARSLGLDDGALFVWSAASAHDVWYPLARPDLGRSPALEVAAGGALRAAGVSVAEISAFDLYSCFPSAVQIAAASLGLAIDVDRPEDVARLTVTGGLPYFGGPGNNYSTHAIASMFDLFRSAGSGLGLVTSVGWYLTKHAVGVYGARPPASAYEPVDTSSAQAALEATACGVVPAGEELAGVAVVDASTVLYDRDGEAVGAPVVATLADGRRLMAAAAAGVAREVAGHFLVGARIHVERAAGSEAAPTYRLIDDPHTPPKPTT